MTTLIFNNSTKLPTLTEIQKLLSEGQIPEKIIAMKSLIHHTLNREVIPQKMLMNVIQFVAPESDHTLKKLGLIYWEIVNKKGSDGKLLSQIILVCNYLLKDLEHPNEFVRGSTLRFLCKIKEQGILEFLISGVRVNLKHDIAYVRKNAYLALASIYQANKNLVEDAPELLYDCLISETDSACRRNAFLMLYEIDEERAIEFLLTVVDDLGRFDESVQLVSLDLIKKIYRKDKTERSKYLLSISKLLDSHSGSVRFEAAKTLLSLTSSIHALRAVGQTYTSLFNNERDNNIKLIVLDLLRSLKLASRSVVSESLLDILRSLTSQPFDIKKKILELAEGLVTIRNAEKVVLLLRFELKETQEQEISNDKEIQKSRSEYIRILIQFLHTIALEFPDMSSQIVDLLIALITSNVNESNKSFTTSEDAVLLIRDIMESCQDLRSEILERLLDQFWETKGAEAIGTLLWIFGEYCLTEEEIKLAYSYIQDCIYEFEEVRDPDEKEKERQKEKENENENENKIEIEKEKEKETEKEKEKEKEIKTTSSNTRITDDFTYVTVMSTDQTNNFEQQANELETSKENKQELLSNISLCLIRGKFFLYSILCTTITKLALRFSELKKEENVIVNKFIADSMLLIICIYKVGKLSRMKKKIDSDTETRIFTCLKVLGDPDSEISKIWLCECRNSLTVIIKEKREYSIKKRKNEGLYQDSQTKIKKKVGDVINISQLHSNNLENDRILKMEDSEEDLKNLIASEVDLNKDNEEDDDDDNDENSRGSSIFFGKKDGLNQIYQLTGFSDPVYAEAVMIVDGFDIYIDALIKNQTSYTLQNLSLELFTLGGLKLIQRQQSYSIGPLGQKTIRTTLKVSSTETGMIFGNITYDVSGTTNQTNCVVLNDISINVLNYLIPSDTSEIRFRKMWADFTWENKISLSQDNMNFKEYIEFLSKKTNMKSLVTYSEEDEEAGFFSTNMYAKSIFGEEVVANVNIAKTMENNITGHFKIRSQTQGLALALGELLK
ncbi:coatomer subunit beta [Anaeramoeba flamelloides]|uniref:Coatomer subunit beta n=1 Tax=Anaeramoeba flamelloides TaxID=1746091 RepID=A0AAV7YMW4_9EUKA|nr:coatomer subunit beta [Anaeramoeba flamelloides]